MGHAPRTRFRDLPRQRFRTVRRPGRRSPRVLRIRNQRLEHRLGPIPSQTLQGWRQSRQRLGHWRTTDGHPCGWHAEQPHRHRSGLVRGNRHSLEVLRPRATRKYPARRRRMVASQLFAGGVAAPSRRRPVQEGSQHAGKQLGLVSPGDYRHAPARTLGLRSVRERHAGRAGCVRRHPRAGCVGYPGPRRAHDGLPPRKVVSRAAWPLDRQIGGSRRPARCLERARHAPHHPADCRRLHGVAGHPRSHGGEQRRDWRCRER